MMGNIRGFDNERGAVSVDGEVVSGYLGIDIMPYSVTLMGVAVSWSDGGMDYIEGDSRGELDAFHWEL